jgi:nitrogen regulatory protein P-II 1
VKLVVAFLPPECLEAVVRALGKAHVHGLSISHARGVGQEYDNEPDFFDFSGAGMTKKVRLESACHDDEVDRILDAIYKAAHTGLRGNGKVFVLPLADALRLKTGERGSAAIGPEA